MLYWRSGDPMRQFVWRRPIISWYSAHVFIIHHHPLSISVFNHANDVASDIASPDLINWIRYPIDNRPVRPPLQRWRWRGPPTRSTPPLWLTVNTVQKCTKCTKCRSDWIRYKELTDQKKKEGNQIEINFKYIQLLAPPCPNRMDDNWWLMNYNRLLISTDGAAKWFICQHLKMMK